MGAGKIEWESGREGEGERKMRITSYKELRVFQSAMDLCMDIFAMSRKFPIEERYSLADQLRRSSRSVCANLAEAWHKRRYPAAFVAKLNDAESEASETQVWLEIAHRCGYVADAKISELDAAYDQVISQLVTMAQNSDQWVIKEEGPPPYAVRNSSPMLSPDRAFLASSAPPRPLSPSPPRMI